jgi:hypothetical protein
MDTKKIKLFNSAGLAAALHIWPPTFSKAFDGLTSVVRETVQCKLDYGELLDFASVSQSNI